MLKIFLKLKNHKRTATSKSKFQSGWKLEEVGGLALGTVHTSTRVALAHKLPEPLPEVIILSEFVIYGCIVQTHCF